MSRILDRHLELDRSDPRQGRATSIRPRRRRAEARLRFYAEQFPIVEVDSTYYFPPSEKNAVLWIDRTPKDFTFNIKAYSLLTNHPTKRESLYKDLPGRIPDELARQAEPLPGAAARRRSSRRSGSGSTTR